METLPFARRSPLNSTHLDQLPKQYSSKASTFAIQTQRDSVHDSIVPMIGMLIVSTILASNSWQKALKACVRLEYPRPTAWDSAKHNDLRAEGPTVWQMAGPSALTHVVFTWHPGRWPGLDKRLGLWPKVA